MLTIVPILLPAVIAAITVIRIVRTTRLAAILSLASSSALVAVAIALFAEASDGVIRVYRLGDWPAPFGIVLMLDRLSTMMVLLTNVLALCVLVHAVITRLDRRGWHFHPMFQFQLLGLNGAFLTGDLFNLFVFFEVLLIASYGLILHGQGAARLQAGVQYVVVNLVGSTLFLIALGVLYGMTGTLNMADMGVRIAAAPAGDQPLIRMGAQILIVVFALKAALLPLQLWLPRAYSNTSAPVAALFAILTKVGVYSILRTTVLIFGAEAGAVAFAPSGWMLPASLLTILAGFVGVLAARNMRLMAAFGVIGSTGTLLSAVALFQPNSVAAALYYLPHSVFSGALMFLVADLVARARRDADDDLAPCGPFARMGQYGALFMLAAIALAGLPPLSGFIGKLLILSASADAPLAPWIWAAILVGTFLGILGLARAGSALFWKSRNGGDALPATDSRLAAAPAWALCALLAALTIFAGPVTRNAEETTAQIFDTNAYKQAVLVDQEGTR